MQEYSTCTNHNSIAKVINTHTPVEKLKALQSLINTIFAMLCSSSH